MHIFRLAPHSLLKSKKYERLVYQGDQTTAEINIIKDSTSEVKVNNQSKTSDRDPQDKIIKKYTFLGNCW